MSNYHETEYQPEVITEYAAQSLFDDMLDDCHGVVEVAGYTYRASYALRNIDPTAYHCEFLDYIDSMHEEFTVKGY